MWITNLAIISRTSNVAVARGFLPVTLNPGNPTDFVQLDTKNSIDFKLSTEPNSIFWQKLAERTGVILTEPNLQADVTGTWAAPRGRIQIRALKIELPKTKSRLPALEHLELDVVLDRQEAVLTNFNLLVQGQPVNATAQIPLGDAFWTDLKAKKIPSWEKATGHLAIKDAQIAAFAKLFPALLSPQGEFSLDVSLTPGANLAGELSLSHGRTRPLPNIGPIRDITMGMMFSGRTVKLKSSTIAIGGSTVVIAGEGDLSGTDWLKGVPPPFEFVLLGTNVPLSHQPESIIRSDLNLAIRKTNGAPPLISGTARLRNSYFFSDLADLVPGRVSTAERRPPYFSIEEPGLADWRLAIHVTGERGLKVRTTLFTGQVTPNVRVEGTLKEPLAIGDVKIESGTVKFPFADLEVQQGFVMLASDDPYRPRLLITAASRKFGYDVKMEMSGPADQPIIQFSSTPPLSSDQLILMVTAGQLPRGGYNLNPQQRAQTMALFLGKDLLSKLGFGDQSEERLSFSSGQDISETGKPTYSLEYKLTDRWSLVGEYDRFNAFNAGVKWKLYSK
jgi:translocation and assembly module TamB